MGSNVGSNVVFYLVCVSWNSSAVDAVVKVNTRELNRGLLLVLCDAPQ
jgi:hypothetical protein